MSWRVVITAHPLEVTGSEAVAKLRDAGCQIQNAPKWSPLRDEDLLAAVSGADAILAGTDAFTATVIAASQASNLKLISRWGVGYDSIDVRAATGQGICIAYTPGLLNEAVADYTFALLCSLARGIHLGHLTMAQGQWKQTWGGDIFGKTLGLVGFGRIGQAVARRAAGFQMRLLAFDPSPGPEGEKLGVKYVSLPTLLAESDFVSLHAALTPQTRGVIGPAQLRSMKPTAHLINTARGALIDEPALAEALRAGVIAGAALDTFAVEPLPAGHVFHQTPNLLLTPHQASSARATGAIVSQAACQAVSDLMNGRRPKWVVNPEVFDSPNLRAKLK
jgi:phosphoglycerate dehydrogenase-like enzyme